MIKLLEAWERLRRRHFIQVWSMIYANRDKTKSQNWAMETVNDEVIREIINLWYDNGMTRP